MTMNGVPMNSLCPNCNKPGPHFAPPSMGEPGFYTCDAATPPEPAKVANADADPNSEMNRALAAVDGLIQSFPFSKDNKPGEELGVLILACVLAIRRIIAAKGITARGPRMKMIRTAAELFESKLRKYVQP